MIDWLVEEVVHLLLTVLLALEIPAGEEEDEVGRNALAIVEEAYSEILEEGHIMDAAVWFREGGEKEDERVMGVEALLTFILLLHAGGTADENALRLPVN